MARTVVALPPGDFLLYAPWQIGPVDQLKGAGERETAGDAATVGDPEAGGEHSDGVRDDGGLGEPVSR
jgi:hypothetical protein